MGSHPNISATTFPLQSDMVGRPATVCFNYDTANARAGTIIRDDTEAPFETIIQLADGRCVRAVECQYACAPSPAARDALNRRDPEARAEIKRTARAIADAAEHADGPLLVVIDPPAAPGNG